MKLIIQIPCYNEVGTLAIVLAVPPCDGQVYGRELK
jgi:hypothetical protein